MIGFLALAAMVLQNPADLTLPYEKAIPLQDDLVSQLPRPLTRDLTGSMVADDGSAILDVNGKVLRIKVGEYQYLAEFPLWQREWEPASAPVTDPQKGWMYLKSGKLDPAKHHFQQTEARWVIRADSEDKFWALHQDKEGGALSAISLEYSDPAGNKFLVKSKDGQYPTIAIADLSSDALLGLMYDGKQQKATDFRLLNSRTEGKLKHTPGIAPFRYDSALDLILCFTYSESGFPYQLIVQHLKSAERETLPRPNGSMTVTALLPKGRVIATFTNRAGDDDQDPKLGLYEFAPPYKEAKYLGPYRLVGSSRNGKWLAVQHRNLRKAWLILTK